jgi:flagellar basal body rod protein FlgG
MVIKPPAYAMQHTPTVMLSTQRVQSALLEQVAQNMAAAGVFGYKAINAKLQEVQIKNPDHSTVSYIKVESLNRDLTSGSVKSTGNAFDFALTGAGYFQVLTPQGVRYTRSGQFRTDEEGRIVTVHGYPVLNENGSEIILASHTKDFAVSQDGTMTLQGMPHGRIGVVTFTDEQAMIPEGFTFLNTDQEPIPATHFHVTQGGLEESNVSMMDCAVRLMEIHRRYEAAQNAMDQYYQVNQKVINLSGKN